MDLRVKAAKGVTHFVASVAQDIQNHEFVKNLCLNICDSVDKTIEEQQVSKNIKKKFETVMPDKVETIRRNEPPALTVEDVNTDESEVDKEEIIAVEQAQDPSQQVENPRSRFSNV
jgi:hypothetical protein